MARYAHYDNGHSRGGVDVTEAVNLVFKGLLLSPIFMLCIFVTIAMLKHMIFGGVPTMHQPTQQQQEAIQERDSQLNVAPTVPEPQVEVVVPEPVYEVIRPTVRELPTVYSLDDSRWNTQIEVDPFS
jgi:hypothetical protein